MNVWTPKASAHVLVITGTRVAFTEGLRTKFGKVTHVLHDHYRIACDDGCVRRVLKERCEPLTDRQNPA